MIRTTRSAFARRTYAMMRLPLASWVTAAPLRCGTRLTSPWHPPRSPSRTWRTTSPQTFATSGGSSGGRPGGRPPGTASTALPTATPSRSPSWMTTFIGALTRSAAGASRKSTRTGLPLLQLISTLRTTPLLLQAQPQHPARAPHRVAPVLLPPLSGVPPQRLRHLGVPHQPVIPECPRRAGPV